MQINAKGNKLIRLIKLIRIGGCPLNGERVYLGEFHAQIFVFTKDPTFNYHSFNFIGLRKYFAE